MGSCQLSCMLSGLPITQGTEVRAFLIVMPEKIYLHEDGEGSQPMRSTDIFAPLTTGIKGTWDETGRGFIAGNDTVYFDMAARHFFPGYGGDASAQINKFMNSRVLAKKRAVDLRPAFAEKKLPRNMVAVSFIREDVYLKALEIDEYRLDMADILEDVQSIRESFEKLYERRSRSGETKEYLLDSIREGMDSCVPFCRVWGLQHIYAVSFEEEGAIYKPYSYALLDAAVNNVPQATDIAVNIAQHLHFTSILNGLNKLWQPSFLASFNMSGTLSLAYEFNKAVADMAADQYEKSLPKGEPGLRGPSSSL